MICQKCNISNSILNTTVIGKIIMITDNITDSSFYLCPMCINKLLNQLAIWKDFEISEEIDLFINPSKPK